jgi:hypothetical protein
MAGRGNGQKFGNSFDDAQDNGLYYTHAALLRGHSGAPIKKAMKLIHRCIFYLFLTDLHSEKGRGLIGRFLFPL